VRVIEEKPKIFELIKNTLRANGCEKSVFVCGSAEFGADIKKYAAENGVIIFRHISPAAIKTEINPVPEEPADLVILGACRNNIDFVKLGGVKSILLNIDNPRGVDSLDKFNKSGKDGQVQIVTCGLKEKDTVIFSSINLDEGSVILDLQRGVKNINGEPLEPFEKQLDISGSLLANPAEDLILALTALTLCGRL